MKVDPKLIKMGDIFRIGAGSPAIDAADAHVPLRHGRHRRPPAHGKLDVGAEELAHRPPASTAC